MQSAGRCLILSDDLIDASRVIGQGKNNGIDVVMQRNQEGLVRAAKAESPLCVFLDLHHFGLNIPKVVSELRQLGQFRVIGYGSHVDTDRLKLARESGCDLVLPRSAFFTKLEQHFQSFLSEE
jgi:CheY-like chemotaxis protein